MGCCPSKQKAANNGVEDGYRVQSSGKELQLDDSPVIISVSVVDDDDLSPGSAPTNMLMDRGDGRPIEYSDHDPSETEKEEPGGIDNQNEEDVTVTVRPAEICVTKEEQSRVTEEPKPITVYEEPKPITVHAETPWSNNDQHTGVTPVSSPSKQRISVEDIPINSMYHRIHLVEVEEQESKRQQEIRAEAERREQEIREYKASLAKS
ncbi:hypothetical protein Poli38472_005172 [Pythium oligandrum]|uniref:Uncharacterized protein n=1 Tax=Pythium oligandrum TaxID=41045 RepID=A0A8K1CGE5_PYTOL|nr:hypothetical protein Poli38472_005172 [Pythium oligandrum]|eukprot:TMW62554.1 hypothetical protein Poli38472_005172 [Pythium oligandrum]